MQEEKRGIYTVILGVCMLLCLLLIGRMLLGTPPERQDGAQPAPERQEGEQQGISLPHEGKANEQNEKDDHRQNEFRFYVAAEGRCCHRFYLAKELAHLLTHMAGDQQTQPGIVRGDKIACHDEYHGSHRPGGYADRKIPRPPAQRGEHSGHHIIQPEQQLFVYPVDPGGDRLGKQGKQLGKMFSQSIEPVCRSSAHRLPAAHNGVDFGTDAVEKPAQSPSRYGKYQDDEKQGEKLA